jgi:BNR repeat-like domain
MKIILVLVLVSIPLAFAQAFRSEPFANPSGAGSVQPNWSVTPDGGALLSWIEPAKDGSYSLRYAVHKGANWSEPRTIAVQRHFFRHPAELPEVVQLSERQWLAHWVEMPKESSEAEYVYTSASSDGVHWTPPTMAHRDRAPVQHGLASMVASRAGETSLFWLKAGQDEEGPTAMMRTILDASGKEIREERLDPDVCACCPTAVAKTAKGLLIAYRDHTPQDIRDISVLRFENGHWSQPKNLYADNWHINACPTNAASVAATGDRVAIAWFTAAQDAPKTEIAFSSDSGSTFTKPATVSTGHSFGYTSVVLDDGGAIVSWLEKGSGGGAARVLVRQISFAGAAGPVVQVSEGGRMGLGYPRLFSSGGDTLVAWGDPKQVQTARLKR